MAHGHCVGNSKIGIPKRALSTSYVTSTAHEAIKVLDKVKQISQEPALAPMVLPIKDVKPTYQQGRSSCKSLENFSHPISIISPISSLAGTLAPQASHDNTMAMLPSVLAYSRTSTPKEDNDTVVVLANFDGRGTTRQPCKGIKNFSNTKSRHQQIGSPASSSPALQSNLLSSLQLRQI